MKISTAILVGGITGLLCLSYFVVQKRIYSPEPMPVHVANYGTVQINGFDYVYFEAGSWLDYPLYRLAVGESIGDENEIILIGYRAVNFRGGEDLDRIISPRTMLIPADGIHEGTTDVVTIQGKRKMQLCRITKLAGIITLEKETGSEEKQRGRPLAGPPAP